MGKSDLLGTVRVSGVSLTWRYRYEPPREPKRRGTV